MLVPNHVKRKGNKFVDYMDNVSTSMVSRLIDNVLAHLHREDFIANCTIIAKEYMYTHSIIIPIVNIIFPPHPPQTDVIESTCAIIETRGLQERHDNTHITIDCHHTDHMVQEQWF